MLCCCRSDFRRSDFSFFSLSGSRVCVCVGVRASGRSTNTFFGSMEISRSKIVKIWGYRWQNSLEGLQIVYGSGCGNPGAIFQGKATNLPSGALFRVGGKTTASLSSSTSGWEIYDLFTSPSLHQEIEVSYLSKKKRWAQKAKNPHFVTVNRRLPTRHLQADVSRPTFADLTNADHDICRPRHLLTICWWVICWFDNCRSRHFPIWLLPTLTIADPDIKWPSLTFANQDICRPWHLVTFHDICRPRH